MKTHHLKVMLSKAALLFLLCIFAIEIYAADFTESYLPKENWPAQEISQEEFLKKLYFFSPVPVLNSYGSLVSSDDQAKLYQLLHTLVTTQKTKFFSFSWDKSIPKDPKHVLVKSNKALAIRAFVLARDYEANAIDGDKACGQWIKQKTTEKKAKKFDTIHVLSVAGAPLKYSIMKEGHPSDWDKFTEIIGNRNYYDYKKYQNWHDQMLKIFKALTDDSTHKLLKGPFDSQKLGKEREEEWGALQDAGIQVVLYENIPVTFFDLNDPSFFGSSKLYILFYAGDGTTNRRKYGIELEYDDIMGIVSIPRELLENIGQQFIYYQIYPTKFDPAHPLITQSAYIDFVVLFEVVSTS